jgi:hypothetical protein
MYYYQWPYTYYYNQPCYWGCTDPSQCKYQYQQFIPTSIDQQQVDYGYPPVEQYYNENLLSEQKNQDEHNNEIKKLHGNHATKIPVNNEYVYKVINKLDALQEKMELIEKENEHLKEKVEKIKPINIENINYKIQELTVEELSGTLNIGLSALTDAENLKKLLEEKGEIKFNDIDTAAMENMEEMEDFNAQ